MLLDLAQNAENEETRRRSALALLHEGWGPPPTSQELVRPAAPVVGVNINLGAPNQGRGPDSAAVYRWMIDGTVPADPKLFRRQPIDAQATEVSP